MIALTAVKMTETTTMISILCGATLPHTKLSQRTSAATMSSGPADDQDGVVSSNQL
jgi:hypothetical protein